MNGDGYADLIVGSPGYTDAKEMRGRVYVFYGSPGGLKAKPDWTATGEAWHTFLGHAVGGAGDVNGDGYDDMLAGAYGVNAGAGFGQGRAYAWCGSPAGLSAAPCWTATGDQAGRVFRRRRVGRGGRRERRRL